MALSRAVAYRRFEDGHSEVAAGHVAAEGLVRLHVNGRELARLMCSPYQLDRLALGFLRSEGIIQELADVRRLVICPSETCVEAWLRDADFEIPERGVITSGCGGGITFADLTTAGQPVTADLQVRTGQIGRLMADLLAGQETRGIHRSALADPGGLLMVAEDVGRHNTIDRLWGQCLLDGGSPEGRILLSTGRISSEMLGKAARMEVPVVVSRSSPTTLSVTLAAAWGITLVGYARRSSLNVYSCHERITDREESAHANAR